MSARAAAPGIGNPESLYSPQVHRRTVSSGRVGVVVRPARTAAVVVEGGAVRSVVPAAAGRSDLESLISGAVSTMPVMPDAVTVDVSPVLLDAVVSGREMAQVAVIRIVPRPATDPTLDRSPARAVERLVAHRFTISGGHDLLGNELHALDPREVTALCARLAASDVRHVAIVSPGSQARPIHEQIVADAVQAVVPGARISVASDYGGQGLVAREATVVLDSALRTVTDRLLRRCEQTLHRLPGAIALRVARGDGGCSTAARIRARPVVALGATQALELTGAAFLAEEADCRVLLPRPGRGVSGEVRHGAAVVAPADLAGIGVELVVPTAALMPEPGLDEDERSHRLTDRPLVHARHDTDHLAGIGAAVSRPSAWLDEVAFIESAGELERVKQDAVDRATAIVMAEGAAPGSVNLIDVSAVALPYSPPGTVRIRVRVTGDPGDGLSGSAALEDHRPRPPAARAHVLPGPAR